MKNTFFKSSYNLWRAVFMSLSILTVSDACAKSSTNGEDNTDKKAVTVQMIVSTDSTITVNVKVDNQHGDKFSIAIENMKEGQLYKEMFTNNAFETNYTLPKPESTMNTALSSVQKTRHFRKNSPLKRSRGMWRMLPLQSCNDAARRVMLQNIRKKI